MDREVQAIDSGTLFSNSFLLVRINYARATKPLRLIEVHVLVSKMD